MSDKWPRRLAPQNMYYVVHKVAQAHIDDDHLYLSYEHEDGRGYSGPFYPSSINGQKPEASHILEQNEITRLDEIEYVVAYHCGAFPPGLPRRLLKSEEEVNALVALAQGALADTVGLIVRPPKHGLPPEHVRRALADEADPPFVAGSIVGWRAWRITPRVPRAFPFPPDTEVVIGSLMDRPPTEWDVTLMEARCVRQYAISFTTHPSRAPAVCCSCGLYGFHDFRDCVRRLLEVDLDKQWLLGLPPRTTVRLIVGRVAGWGKVIEHEQGFRAQYARPMPRFLVSVAHRDLVAPLGGRAQTDHVDSMPGLGRV